MRVQGGQSGAQEVHLLLAGVLRALGGLERLYAGEGVGQQLAQGG